MTRPSGLARDTLRLPIRLRELLSLVRRYEPDKHNISNRPYGSQNGHKIYDQHKSFRINGLICNPSLFFQIGGSVGGMLIAASPVQVIVGSFVWGGSKTKNKKGGGQDGLKDSDNQSVDDLVAPPGMLQTQNLSPSLPAGVWPGPRSMDMRNNSHVDIDLMRG